MTAAEPKLAWPANGERGPRAAVPVMPALPAGGALAPVTLRTLALAAVASCLPRLPEPATAESRTAPAEARYLQAHRQAISEQRSGWPGALERCLQEPAPGDIPLMALAGSLGLTALELIAVALAAAVEADAMVGRALAFIQAPVGGSRPTLGLLATAFGIGLGEPAEHVIDLLIAGAAMRSGLLELTNDGAPLPERAVRLPVHLALALAGLDGAVAGATVGIGSFPEVPLAPSVAAEARRHAAALASAPQRALVIRTGSPAEGRAVAAAIAAALDRRPIFLETEQTTGLAPWLILRRLLPVFCLELGPGERKVLPAIPQYTGPVLALCGPDGSVSTAGGAALSWALPVPPRDERHRLWALALGDDALAGELARHHRHGSGRIAHLGRLAHHRSSLRGSDRPALEDVVAASWTGEGAGLESLAEPLPDVIPDEALVLTPSLRAELRLLLLRCRARDRLVEGLGASATARYRPGVRALFVGPSGTGKTLAAGWLATRLGLPLYRVDLAAVTSKYIGETEKNLAQLLARAEQSEVVLLFDEADSLFGKRTEVKEANDRFANAQTNYLLQRIETFDGIAILTSNSRNRFDSAFSRRLDVIVEFVLPGPEERRTLWCSHLGAGHALSQREINQLAATADVAGGHIRNAVLAAAVVAQEESRPITYTDVIQGLAGEYRKLGRQLPAELTRVT